MIRALDGSAPNADVDGLPHDAYHRRMDAVAACLNAVASAAMNDIKIVTRENWPTKVEMVQVSLQITMYLEAAQRGAEVLWRPDENSATAW